MSQSAKAGDTITQLLRKILANQGGAEVTQAGDGERDLWRKILINQAAGNPI